MHIAIARASARIYGYSVGGSRTPDRPKDSPASLSREELADLSRLTGRPD